MIISVIDKYIKKKTLAIATNSKLLTNTSSKVMKHHSMIIQITGKKTQYNNMIMNKVSHMLIVF